VFLIWDRGTTRLGFTSSIIKAPALFLEFPMLYVILFLGPKFKKGKLFIENDFDVPNKR
jgi:hypothetical protein